MSLNLGLLIVVNPARLLWLLLLIPLILFYLIRPKPRVKEIPSLMFFMKSSGRSRLLNFFKIFVYDLMLLVQLAIILALVLTPSQPFSNVQHDITAANTVIVLDSSASMQTMEGAETRFERGIDAAKDSLATRNTLVVAEARSHVEIQEANARDAAGVLNFLKSTDSGSRIGDAIILAGELLRGKEGRVVVISDFIATGGVDPAIAKAVLQSRGIAVTFINVGSAGKNNVGFVDAVIEDDSTTAYVKNFNDDETTITLALNDNEKQLTIPSKGVEPYVFKTIPNLAELRIKNQDDFAVDNVLFTSAPAQQPVKLLLISNKPSDFLQTALKASPDLELTLAKPPVIPKGEFDITVIHNVAPEEVLAGTYEDVLRNAQNTHKTAIVTAQENSLAINYRGLVPFGLTGDAQNGFVRIENPTRFTKNIEFGKLPTYFTTTQLSGIVPVATAGNNTAIITVATLQGGGKLIWYGILEKGSDFKFSPYYPIFWHELIKFATSQQDIKSMNQKTGDTLLLDRQTEVLTPAGKDKTNRLVFSRAGIYKLPGRSIAANLLNEQESDISQKASTGEAPESVELAPVRETRRLAWELPLIIAALIILFMELAYVKLRGDV